jgi:hypothetical protein
VDHGDYLEISNYLNLISELKKYEWVFRI